MHAPTNPYDATIGLRVDPASAGSGYGFALDVPHDVVPLHIYRRLESFTDAMREYVRAALDHGRYGWRVTDCVVTMTECFYGVADGPPSRSSVSRSRSRLGTSLRSFE